MRQLREHRRLGALGLSYTIARGDQDAERLGRQAEVMGSSTGDFLLRIGIEAGWRCLDVGCGQGHVTGLMAELVGPGGGVLGVDLDAEAVAGARRAVPKAGFRVLDATTDSLGEGEFDLAYARLLLSHLDDPCAVLRAMQCAVRPGGAVAAEDLRSGTLRSDPARPVLDEFQHLYMATVRHTGGDPVIGPRLRALLAHCGLEEITEAWVENPMPTVPERQFIPETLHSMRTAILEAGLAQAAEVDDMARRLEAAAQEPSTVFYQARIYQVSGRRPVQGTPPA